MASKGINSCKQNKHPPFIRIRFSFMRCSTRDRSMFNFFHGFNTQYLLGSRSMTSFSYLHYTGYIFIRCRDHSGRFHGSAITFLDSHRINKQSIRTVIDSTMSILVDLACPPGRPPLSQVYDGMPALRLITPSRYAGHHTSYIGDLTIS